LIRGNWNLAALAKCAADTSEPLFCPVDTENLVRSENAEVPTIGEIMVLPR
jgi:hypothetical protein